MIFQAIVEHEPQARKLHKGYRTVAHPISLQSKPEWKWERERELEFLEIAQAQKQAHRAVAMLHYSARRIIFRSN